MSYEGIPTGKKKSKEGAKEKPAHPAPKHEAVFGKEDTIITLENRLQESHKESVSKETPAHDALFDDKHEIYDKMAQGIRKDYQEGMGVSADDYEKAVRGESLSGAPEAVTDLAHERKRRESKAFLKKLIENITKLRGERRNDLAAEKARMEARRGRRDAA